MHILLCRTINFAVTEWLSWSLVRHYYYSVLDFKAAVMMARPMVPSQQKLAEKLTLINDRGVGMLTRIYNIKKVCLVWFHQMILITKLMFGFILCTLVFPFSMQYIDLLCSSLFISIHINNFCFRHVAMRSQNQHFSPTRPLNHPSNILCEDFPTLILKG